MRDEFVYPLASDPDPARPTQRRLKEPLERAELFVYPHSGYVELRCGQPGGFVNSDTWRDLSEMQ